jgi:hypothetical protein
MNISEEEQKDIDLVLRYLVSLRLNVQNAGSLQKLLKDLGIKGLTDLQNNLFRTAYENINEKDDVLEVKLKECIHNGKSIDRITVNVCFRTRSAKGMFKHIFRKNYLEQHKACFEIY